MVGQPPSSEQEAARRKEQIKQHVKNMLQKLSEKKDKEGGSPKGSGKPTV